MNAQPPARTKYGQANERDEEDQEEPFLIGGKPVTTADQMQPVGDAALPDPKVDPDFYADADYVKGEYGEEDADYPSDEYEDEGEEGKRNVSHGTKRVVAKHKRVTHPAHKGVHKPAAKKKSLFSSWK